MAKRGGGGGVRVRGRRGYDIKQWEPMHRKIGGKGGGGGVRGFCEETK